MTISQRFAADIATIDATTAADLLHDDAVVAVSGFGSVGYPKAIPSALAESDRELSLTVISGGSVGNEIDTDLVETGAIERRYPYQARLAARNAVNAGRIAYQDRHIARLGEEVLIGGLPHPDVAIVEAIAVGDGWIIPSTSIGQTPAFVEAADQVIVELNYGQPLTLQMFHDIYRVGTPPREDAIPLKSPGGRIGGPKIHFESSKLTGVVETDSRDQPYDFREPNQRDKVIAANLGEFIESELERNPTMDDSIRLQFGVGSLGNALMGAFESVEFGDRDVIYYGEVIQDGLLDMLDADTLSVASATSLALSVDGQDRLFENAKRYANGLVLRPASISNRATFIDQFGVVAVNTALEVDLYGHVNSTHLQGSQVVNGVGGSGDFTRNAVLSIITLGSTVSSADVSRIVPMVPHVDHTEHDVDIIVTEHGVADLRGLAPTERAHSILENCADPAYRADLWSYLERAGEHGGHVPHDLTEVFEWSADES